MKKTIRKGTIAIVGIMFCVLTCYQQANGADANIYAEGVYMENETWISIYADFDKCVMSFGFTLTYDPLELLVLEATKNEDVWYFGDGNIKYPYMDPDTSILGQVVFVGGKLDVNDPLAGVCGTRVFLGEVKFRRLQQIIPSISIDPTAQLGLVSFITTASQVLDDNQGGVVFGPALLFNASGDEDQDGSSNMEEYMAGTNPGDNNSRPDQVKAIPVLNTYGLVAFFVAIAICSFYVKRKKKWGYSLF